MAPLTKARPLALLKTPPAWVSPLTGEDMDELRQQLAQILDAVTRLEERDINDKERFADMKADAAKLEIRVRALEVETKGLTVKMSIIVAVATTLGGLLTKIIGGV